MRLVCATAEWVNKYAQLCDDRQLGISVWPSRLCLLVADGKELVAGVMVYDTSGPFLFFEHLVTNETASLRQRHKAVEMMAGEMVSMCRHLAKVPMVLVRHQGLKRILKRYGLNSPGAEVMTCPFYALEKHDYEEVPRSHPEFPDAARDPTDRAPPLSFGA